jgi:hypothetical protein
MNWNFRVANTTASKMPMDWMEQRKIVVYHVTYFAKTYNIPPHLLVNTDQTRLHVVPIARERSWESRGTKQIQVLCVEDKRQVTIVASLTADGNLLLLQVVFTRTTRQ